MRPQCCKWNNPVFLQDNDFRSWVSQMHRRNIIVSGVHRNTLTFKENNGWESNYLPNCSCIASNTICAPVLSAPSVLSAATCRFLHGEIRMDAPKTMQEPPIHSRPRAPSMSTKRVVFDSIPGIIWLPSFFDDHDECNSQVTRINNEFRSFSQELLRCS